MYISAKGRSASKRSLKCCNVIVIYETRNADNQRNPSDSLLTTVPLQLVPDAFFYPPTIS